MQYSSCCNNTLHAQNSVTILQTPQFPGSLNRLCASSAEFGLLALQNTKHLTASFLNLCSLGITDREVIFCNKLLQRLNQKILVSHIKLFQL